jgi:hypothetical protein
VSDQTGGGLQAAARYRQMQMWCGRFSSLESCTQGRLFRECPSRSYSKKLITVR